MDFLGNFNSRDLNGPQGDRDLVLGEVDFRLDLLTGSFSFLTLFLTMIFLVFLGLGSLGFKSSSNSFKKLSNSSTSSEQSTFNMSSA